MIVPILAIHTILGLKSFQQSRKRLKPKYEFSPFKPDISIETSLTISKTKILAVNENSNKPETKYTVGWVLVFLALVYDKFFSGMH